MVLASSPHLHYLQLPLAEFSDAFTYRVSVHSWKWNSHTVFRSSCTNEYSPQQCMKVPVPSCPHQHLIGSFKKICHILIGVSWWFSFEFSSWLMMLRILMCSFDIHISSLVKCSFKSLPNTSLYICAYLRAHVHACAHTCTHTHAQHLSCLLEIYLQIFYASLFVLPTLP